MHRRFIALILAIMMAFGCGTAAFADAEPLPTDTDTGTLAETQADSGIFVADAEYISGTDTQQTADDVTVKVEVEVKPEGDEDIAGYTVTAGKTPEADATYQQQVAPMEKIYEVSQNKSDTADDIKIIAAGDVSLATDQGTKVYQTPYVEDQNHIDAKAKTKLKVTFDNTLYNWQTDDIVLKSYYEDKTEGGTERVFSADYKYIQDADIEFDDNNNKVTVDTVLDGICSWILGIIKKAVGATLYAAIDGDVVKTEDKTYVYKNFSEWKDRTVSHELNTVTYNSTMTVDYFDEETEQNKTLKYIYDTEAEAYSTSQCNKAYRMVGEGENTVFDILAKVNDVWYKTTDNYSGYKTVLQADDKASLSLTILADFTNNEYTAQNTDFENGVLVTYVVTNSGDTTKTFSLGSYANVQIGMDDYAVIKPYKPDTQVLYGYEMTSKVKCDAVNKNEATLKLICYQEGHVTTGVKSVVNSIWYGDQKDLAQNIFQTKDTKTEVGTLSYTNSAIAYGWTEQEIAAGETQYFRVLFGDIYSGGEGQGDNPGSGDNPGGTNPGSGDNPGGTNPGSGDNPGGTNPGGTNPGSGDNPGGTNPGSGDNPGGTNPGSGDNPGGTNPGSGDNPGGTNPGGKKTDDDKKDNGGKDESGTNSETDGEETDDSELSLEELTSPEALNEFSNAIDDGGYGCIVKDVNFGDKGYNTEIVIKDSNLIITAEFAGKKTELRRAVLSKALIDALAKRKVDNIIFKVGEYVVTISINQLAGLDNVVITVDPKTEVVTITVNDVDRTADFSFDFKKN